MVFILAGSSRLPFGSGLFPTGVNAQGTNCSINVSTLVLPVVGSLKNDIFQFELLLIYQVDNQVVIFK